VVCLLGRGICAQVFFLSPTVNKELLKGSQGFEVVIQRRSVIFTNCSTVAFQIHVAELLGWDVTVTANYHL